jgi:hypothetical protein
LTFFSLFLDYPFRKASDSEDSPSANPRTRFSKRIIQKKGKEDQAFGYRVWEFLIRSLQTEKCEVYLYQQAGRANVGSLQSLFSGWIKSARIGISFGQRAPAKNVSNRHWRLGY